MVRANHLLLSCFLVTVLVAQIVAAEPVHVAIETVQRFHAALAEQDRDEVLALLAEDVLIFESGGAEFSREEYAGHHLGADMKFSAATNREITEQQTGLEGETAWVLTRSATVGIFRGNEIDVRGVETMMLRDTEEGWKIFHIHWSSRSRD